MGPGAEGATGLTCAFELAWLVIDPASLAHAPSTAGKSTAVAGQVALKSVKTRALPCVHDPLSVTVQPHAQDAAAPAAPSKRLVALP